MLFPTYQIMFTYQFCVDRRSVFHQQNGKQINCSTIGDEWCYLELLVKEGPSGQNENGAGVGQEQNTERAGYMETGVTKEDRGSFMGPGTLGVRI